MANFYSLREEIISDFERNKIDISKPGFYDEPNFLKIEKLNPEYLINYARFVQEKDYSADYLEKARKVIPLITRELHRELLNDGRLGACIDLSMILSRILEREGFWNYVVKGSLTVSFPDYSGIDDRYFWSFDYGEFSAAHAWVVAPPFGVIDLTIKQQKRDSNELEYFPDLIMSEELSPDLAKVEDLLSPDVRQVLQLQGVESKNMISEMGPTLENVLATFKAGTIEQANTRFKYVPVAIGAPDGSLEDMFGISAGGLSAIEIYNTLIKPLLMAAKF